MGATIQQKQQKATISSSFTFEPNFTLSPSHIASYMENAVIFEVPSFESQLKCSNQELKSGIKGKNPLGSRNKIGLTCSVRRTQKVYKKYIMKRINTTAQNQHNLNKSLSKINQASVIYQDNICKVAGYKKQYDGFMCGMHSGVSVVFEYWGNHTLAEEIRLRSQELISKTKRIRDQDSLYEMMEYTFDLAEILRTTKFQLDIAKKLDSLNEPIPKLVLSDLIFKEPYNSASTLKYRNPIDSLYCEHNETIYRSTGLQASQLEEQSAKLGAKMVQNIGVCIMSMCLLEDCYESCFNFIGEMCISVVEKKIEYIYELYSKKTSAKISKQLCKMLEAFVLQNRSQNRISLSQANSLYNKIYLGIEQERITKLQESFLGQQFDQELWRGNKNAGLREEETSASMVSKTKKQNSHQSYSDNYRSVCHSMQLSNDRLNRLGSVWELSGKEKKEWKIDKSSQRKIQINQTIKPRTKQWTIQQEENRQKTQRPYQWGKENTHACYEIDKKWSEDDELFKHMPEFERFSSTVLNFHFNNHELEPIPSSQKEGRIL